MFSNYYKIHYSCCVVTGKYSQLFKKTLPQTLKFEKIKSENRNNFDDESKRPEVDPNDLMSYSKLSNRFSRFEEGKYRSSKILFYILTITLNFYR